MAEIPRKKNEPIRPSPGGLDLGFGELLGEPSKKEENSEIQPQKPFFVSTDPKSDDPLLSFALSDKWDELEKRCDEILRSHPNDSEASLWWIRTQLKKGGVPLFVLASPLDAVLKRVVSGEVSSGVKELAKGVTQEFVSVLKEREDTETLKAFMPHLEALGIKIDTSNDLKVDKNNFAQSEAEAWNKKDTSGKVINKSSTNPIRAFLLLSLLAFAFYYLFASKFVGSSAEDGIVVASTPNLDGSKKALIPPTVDRVKVGDLDALYYGMGEKTKETVAAVEVKNEVTEERQVQPKEQIVDARIPKLPSQSERERIDTTGPKEPESPREDRDRYESRGGRQDPDIGYEVERYRTPRRFEVVADTMVLSRPSHQGKPVSRLRRGDEIVAHERVGYWLKIYSDKGSPGFVLEQDAIPARR